MAKIKALTLRISIVVVVLGALLVPAWSSPRRTIYVPRTLSAGKALAGSGITTLALRPTHVAFTWRGTDGSGIRFRTVSPSGERSPWTRAAEAHDLEHGNHHYSGVIGVDRPSRVQWRKVVAPGGRVSDIHIEYMNTEDGPLRAVTIPSVAEASADTPTIVTRAQWGADESLKSTSGGCERDFHTVQQLFVHHTAGSNSDKNYAATMRAIYHFHTKSRGWCDVGYNFVIAPDGTIFEGRWARNYSPWETHTSETRDGRAVVGAHVAGYNSGSVGISMMGNFTSTNVTAEARRSLVSMLSWEADRHGLQPTGKHTYRNPDSSLTDTLPYIAGHRDAGQTACPGSRLYSSLPAIRKSVKDQIAPSRAVTALSLAAAKKKLYAGESTSVGGTLHDASGAPLPGRQVTVYERVSGSSWVARPPLTTGPDGSFGYEVTPERSMRIAASYVGDATTWGAESGRVKIRVKPVVELHTDGATPDATGVEHFPSGTRRVPLEGDVTPDLSGRKVKVKIFKVKNDSERLKRAKVLYLDDASGYATGFRPRKEGDTYRAVTWYKRGGGYAAARSNVVFFTTDTAGP